MTTQTFACPACGSKKTLDDPRPGEKLHCTCGMSYPASPVFAVAAAKYAGKVVEVRAHGRVAKDSLGRPYFGAEVVKPREGRPSARLSPEERRWEVEGYPPSVRCYLTPEQAAALEEVPAGREV